MIIRYNKVFVFWLISLILNGDIVASDCLFNSNADHVSSAISCLTNCTKTLIKNVKIYQKHKIFQTLTLKKKKNIKLDDFNLPLHEDVLSNLPFEEVSASNDIFNMPFDIVSKCGKKQVYPHQLKKVRKSCPNIALSFKTSLLARLFLNKRGIFDTDGYHSMPVSLIQLMLQYGKMSFEEKRFKQCNNVQIYKSYGLLYSIGSMNKGKLIERFVPIQARLLTTSNKKIDNVIFHIGFEKLKQFKNKNKHQDDSKQLVDYCLSIDTLILAKEKNKVWKHVLERKVPKIPFFININKGINTVPLIDMIKVYGPHFRKDDLFVFPCPNKNFFATTKNSITGSLLIDA